MKKFVIIAVALCLLLAAAAEGARESIKIEAEGRSLTLDFDPSEEYSMVSGGLARASFYTYADQSSRLYEVTLIFPADVRSGDVIDTQYALASNPECSVVAVFTRDAAVTYYFAGVMDGTAYPDNASFAITFDEVTDAESGRTYTGRLTASLVGMDIYSDSGLQHYRIDAAPFSFTMPAANHISADDDLDGYNPFDAEPGGEGAAMPAPSPTPEVIRV